MSADATPSEFNIDFLLQRLLTGFPFDRIRVSGDHWSQCVLGNGKANVVEAKACHMSEDEINFICTRVKDILLNESMLLDLQAPLLICGNSNKSIHSTKKNFISRFIVWTILGFVENFQLRSFTVGLSIFVPWKLYRSW